MILSLLTAILWGLLPVALKALLSGVDPYTITWFRFLVAAIILVMVVGRRRGYAVLRRVGWSGRALTLIAIAGLCGNYIVYLLGLDFITPSAAQVVIQLAPVFLLCGGIMVFGERFRVVQWIGVAILIAGLLLFFNRRLEQIFEGLGTETSGVLLIIVSGLAWAIYALAQKQLLREMPSSTILLLICVAGAIFFFFPARPEQLQHLDHTQWLLLAFCALNTVFAYGCFSEALNHLEASRVSVVLAVTPLVTVLVMTHGAALFPTIITSETLSSSSVAGAVLVVVGSAMSAVNRSGMNRRAKGNVVSHRPPVNRMEAERIPPHGETN